MTTRLKMIALAGVLLSCTTPKGPGAANLAADNAVPVTDTAPASKVLTECPPYVYIPSRDNAIGTPDGVVGHPGLPIDVRDKRETLDPYGFGCYGACGPSCKVTCFDLPEVTRIYRLHYSDGQESYRSCTYQVKTCRSDAMCRWHDDCYRQADVAQYESSGGNLSEPLSTFGVNAYRMCDKAPASAEAWKYLVPPLILNLSGNQKICWARYAQGLVPDDVVDCWDQTHGNYATLQSEEAVEPDCENCADAIDLRRPFESSGITVWEPAIDHDTGAPMRASFEEVRAICRYRGLRLPTISELEQGAPEQADKFGSTGCLWSASATLEVLNGRKIWQYPHDDAGTPFESGIYYQTPDAACAALCVNAGNVNGL